MSAMGPGPGSEWCPPCPGPGHVVGCDEGDPQQVLAEAVRDGLQVVDGGQRYRALQHFVRLRGGLLQKE